MRWFMYVVRCSDDTLYTGVTTDLKRRLHEHNSTKRAAKYTKTRRPVKLVYFEEFEDRSSAQSAEYSFKKLIRQKKWEKINENQIR